MRAVYLSPVAQFKLESLIEHINHNWGEKERKHFLKKFNDGVDLVRHFPNSCTESIDIPGIYRCVVSANTSFFYRTSEEAIEIITVFDNRQDPEYLLIEIKRIIEV